MAADTGWCRGCFRTIDEIVQWARLDEDQKRAVWGQLLVRAQASESPSVQQTRLNA